jgi:hypothetical protein
VRGVANSRRMWSARLLYCHHAAHMSATDHAGHSECEPMSSTHSWCAPQQAAATAWMHACSCRTSAALPGPFVGLLASLAPSMERHAHRHPTLPSAPCRVLTCQHEHSTAACSASASSDSDPALLRRLQRLAARARHTLRGTIVDVATADYFTGTGAVQNCINN